MKKEPLKRKPIGESYSHTKFVVDKGDIIAIKGVNFMVGKINRKGFYLKQVNKNG